MLSIGGHVQPADGSLASTLRSAAANPRYERVDVAVAYVTVGGLDALRFGQSGGELSRLDCRWLSCFDWCRSDPQALSALDSRARSEVRISDGSAVVHRSSCRPVTPFHPKGFLFSGRGARLLVSGSGNLSRNGMISGTELDTIIEVTDPSGPVESDAWRALEAIDLWFASAWSQADAYAGLAEEYRKAHAAAPSAPPVTDDDSFPAHLAMRGYGADDLIAIRRASIFWIEAGKLTENLGAGNPGNQLMTRALTRVFFGFLPDALEPKSPIGSIAIRYDGITTDDLTIQYAHNGMDRLNLPRPGAGGPSIYDGTTLVFTRSSHEGRVLYNLSIADARAARSLRTKSARSNLSFAMPGGGRKFGFIIQ
jgi:hypothetical protein